MLRAIHSTEMLQNSRFYSCFCCFFSSTKTFWQLETSGLVEYGFMDACLLLVKGCKQHSLILSLKKGIFGKKLRETGWKQSQKFRQKIAGFYTVFLHRWSHNCTSCTRHGGWDQLPFALQKRDGLQMHLLVSHHKKFSDSRKFGEWSTTTLLITICEKQNGLANTFEWLQNTVEWPNEVQYDLHNFVWGRFTKN